jgi:hypothetical protein
MTTPNANKTEWRHLTQPYSDGWSNSSELRSDFAIKRTQYRSLDDFAKEEGLQAVLNFLAYQPTVVDGYYRHTQMPVLPYNVTKWHTH